MFFMVNGKPLPNMTQTIDRASQLVQSSGRNAKSHANPGRPLSVSPCESNDTHTDRLSAKPSAAPGTCPVRQGSWATSTSAAKRPFQTLPLFNFLVRSLLTLCAYMANFSLATAFKHSHCAAGQAVTPAERVWKAIECRAAPRHQAHSAIARKTRAPE